MNKLWDWPGDAQAAVSLTYDDGVDSGLDHAVPGLEKAGFLGTFYLPIGYHRVATRKADWKNAFLSGLEIGNHTIRRPCRGPTHGRRLEAYTAADIHGEILTAVTWLNYNIGVNHYRTFAYPCGHVAIGGPPDEDSF